MVLSLQPSPLVKTFILCLLFTLTMSVQAQDLESEENKYLGYIYQQPSYQLDDPKGDILLLWTAKQVPQYIWASLVGKGSELREYREDKIEELLIKFPVYHPEQELLNLSESDYNPYNTNHEPIILEGHKNPYKVNHVILMMKQVIVEEMQKGMTPLIGKPHEWSPENEKKLKKMFPLFRRISKALVALARGVTSNFMVTGTEDQLKEYIVSRPRDSITLEEMFRASYRINGGDVYLALLTVENILSRFWSTPGRDRLTITTKLKTISNYNYKDDKFGSWYHLFGVMYFGYVQGRITSQTVGMFESLGSHILGRKDEQQEDFINRTGGRIGAALRQFVEKKGYQRFVSNPHYLNEKFYMTLDENFAKRLNKAKKKAARTADKTAKKKAAQ